MVLTLCHFVKWFVCQIDGLVAVAGDIATSTDTRVIVLVRWIVSLLNWGRRFDAPDLGCGDITQHETDRFQVLSLFFGRVDMDTVFGD